MSESEQKKSKKPKLNRIYEYDQEKWTIELKNKKCPRCGKIMAFHKTPKQRWTCGSCSYTEFVKKTEKN
jgi:small subunit ribosomal protein S27Ae